MHRYLRLIVLGIVGAVPAATLAEEPVRVPAEELRPAIAKSLPLLLKGAIGHRENRTCFACHNQGLPILALDRRPGPRL